MFIIFPLWILGVIMVICCASCAVGALIEFSRQPLFVIAKTVGVFTLIIAGILIMLWGMGVNYGLW